jgi:hypothetical protein
MKVSYEESLANCFGLLRRCGDGNVPVLNVWNGGKRRPAIELRNLNFRVPTRSLQWEGNTMTPVNGEGVLDATESGEPVHAWKSQTREPGDPFSSRRNGSCERDGWGTTPWESPI